MGDGEYLVMINGEVIEFQHWDEIPDTFEHMIKFYPNIPPEPHTPEQHHAIDQIPNIFKQFMEKERASSHKNR